MRYALAAGICVIFAITAQAATDFVRIGKPGKLDTAFIGCKTKDNTTKIKALFRANDREAAAKYAVSKIPDCKPMSEGMVGTVESLSAWTGDSCIRPKGEPECYWVPVNFVIEP